MLIPEFRVLLLEPPSCLGGRLHRQPLVIASLRLRRSGTLAAAAGPVLTLGVCSKILILKHLPHYPVFVEGER
jgi:hypothetical protein